MSPAAVFFVATIALGRAADPVSEGANAASPRAAVAVVTRSPAAVEPAARVLTIRYANGRTVSHIVTAEPRSAWTPLFPTARGGQTKAGLPVTALAYRFRLEATAVRVEVSVLLGQPHREQLLVERVVVGESRPTRIARLRDLGVEPVVLSVEEFVPSTLYQPQVENKTAALQVEDVEVVTTPSPAYRVTVRNYSPKPVMTFHVETYEAGRRRFSVRHGHRDGSPAVAPGGTFRFHVNTPRSQDIVGITGLMFEDGTIEGDATGVHLTRVVYAGRRSQLGAVLKVFGQTSRGPIADPAATIARLRAQVAALSVASDPRALQSAAGLLPPDGPFTSREALDGAFSAALREVRDAVLEDLEVAPRELGELVRWLEETRDRYRQRYVRFLELTLE